MLLSPELQEKIEKIIKAIEKEYQYTQGLILSEHDLQSLIYSRLRSYFISLNKKYVNGEIPSLNERLAWRMKTMDSQIYASPVHTEIPWYDENGKLTIKPDITLLEPSELSILHGIGFNHKIPSKQFVFGGKAIIFELKFIRNKTGIRKKTIESLIKKDFKKIKRLDTKLSQTYGTNKTMFCYFVIFNKTNFTCDEFKQYLNNNGQGRCYKIMYCTGNVDFRRETPLKEAFQMTFSPTLASGNHNNLS
jgi:hypothetical protein